MTDISWDDIGEFPTVEIDASGNDVLKTKKKGRPKKTGVARYSGGGIRKRPKVTENIIAIDGEGEYRNGPSGPRHTYTLVCVSNGNGYKKKISIPKTYKKKREGTKQRQANYGLRTLNLLEFILQVGEDNPYSLMVGFAFQYDFVQIIKDLPKHNIEQLCSNDKRTEWKIKFRGEDKHYGIEYVPKKQLIIKEGKSFVKDKQGRTKPKWDRHVTIWDVFGFFQTSFVNTLDKWNMADEETLERILAMKEQRFDFTQCTEKQIEEYCYEECDLLVKLTREFLHHVNEVGLNLTRFDGAGALAGAWLKKKDIKKYKDDTNLDEEIALQGYYGGRFEISHIGHVGPCYAHDINSAYPFFVKDLPCLAHGEFKRTKKFIKSRKGIYRVSYYGTQTFAPFPWRNKDGNVFYKLDAKDSEAARWIWDNELKVVLDNEPENIVIHEGYYYIQECDHKPFAEIEEMYNYRLKHKGTGADKVIKLIINSIYGKLAQSVGYASNRKYGFSDFMNHNINEGKPSYQSFIWAGMITSGCRAMILDAIYKGNGNIRSIATDGILSVQPIRDLNYDNKKFGAWDQEYYTDMYLFQSGILIGVTEGTVIDAMKKYKKMEKLKGKKNLTSIEQKRLNGYKLWFYGDKRNPPKMLYKTRGFSENEIPPYVLIDGWHNEEIRNGSKDLTYPIRPRFINHKIAMMRNNPTEVLGEWIPSTREIKYMPNRRLLKGYLDYDEGTAFDYTKDVWDTIPLINTEMSHPFKKKTERSELDEREFDHDNLIDDIEYM